MEMMNAFFILLVFFGVAGLGIFIVISAAKRRPGEKYFKNENIDKMLHDPDYSNMPENDYYMSNEIVINPAFKDMSVNIHHDRNE